MTAAQAAIPASNGVISGCYDNKTGAVRIIDAAKTECKGSEKLITWNQKGLKGDTGATGATGPAGPAGPAGACWSNRSHWSRRRNRRNRSCWSRWTRW